jgi:hypothetical protein
MHGKMGANPRFAAVAATMYLGLASPAWAFDKGIEEFLASPDCSKADDIKARCGTYHGDEDTVYAACIKAVDAKCPTPLAIKKAEAMVGKEFKCLAINGKTPEQAAASKFLEMTGGTAESLGMRLVILGKPEGALRATMFRVERKMQAKDNQNYKNMVASTTEEGLNYCYDQMSQACGNSPDEDTCQKDTDAAFGATREAIRAMAPKPLGFESGIAKWLAHPDCAKADDIKGRCADTYLGDEGNACTYGACMEAVNGECTPLGRFKKAGGYDDVVKGFLAQPDCSKARNIRDRCRTYHGDNAGILAACVKAVDAACPAGEKTGDLSGDAVAKLTVELNAQLKQLRATSPKRTFEAIFMEALDNLARAHGRNVSAKAELGAKED